MVTHTKALFSSVLKMTAADCVCDIGSRDGDQALLFRHLLPLASIIAFEANPINFQQMAGRGALEDEGVDIFPYAITNHENGATFYVTDVDYTNPQENVGTSSLLVHDGLKILESVKVETRRIDQFITTHYPTARRIGLWIDVEGAEYGVIEGMDKIKDQIVALHVEVAKKPMRQNQKTYADLEPLLASMGFVPCGSNLNAESVWGDVVFLNRNTIAVLGWRLHWIRLKALATCWLGADRIAVTLKGRMPWLYRSLRRVYIWLGT